MNTINNAKLQNCFKLSSKVTVYVPATNGVSEATDNTEQVKKTASLLAGLFGGSTSTAALGYWLSPIAGLVSPMPLKLISRRTSARLWSCARS